MKLLKKQFGPLKAVKKKSIKIVENARTQVESIRKEIDDIQSEISLVIDEVDRLEFKDKTMRKKTCTGEQVFRKVLRRGS